MSHEHRRTFSNRFFQNSLSSVEERVEQRAGELSGISHIGSYLMQSIIFHIQTFLKTNYRFVKEKQVTLLHLLCQQVHLGKINWSDAGIQTFIPISNQ